MKPYLILSLLLVSCSSSSDTTDATIKPDAEARLDAKLEADIYTDTSPTCDLEASDVCQCLVHHANQEVVQDDKLWSPDFTEACHNLSLMGCGSVDQICFNATCSQEQWNIYISSVWSHQCLTDCQVYNCPDSCVESCPQEIDQ